MVDFQSDNMLEFDKARHNIALKYSVSHWNMNRDHDMYGTPQYDPDKDQRFDKSYPAYYYYGFYENAQQQALYPYDPLWVMLSRAGYAGKNFNAENIPFNIGVSEKTKSTRYVIELLDGSLKGWSCVYDDNGQWKPLWNYVYGENNGQPYNAKVDTTAEGQQTKGQWMMMDFLKNGNEGLSAFGAATFLGVGTNGSHQASYLEDDKNMKSPDIDNYLMISCEGVRKGFYVQENANSYRYREPYPEQLLAMSQGNYKKRVFYDNEQYVNYTPPTGQTNYIIISGDIMAIPLQSRAPIPLDYTDWTIWQGQNLYTHSTADMRVTYGEDAAWLKYVGSNYGKQGWNDSNTFTCNLNQHPNAACNGFYSRQEYVHGSGNTFDSLYAVKMYTVDQTIHSVNSQDVYVVKQDRMVNGINGLDGLGTSKPITGNDSGDAIWYSQLFFADNHTFGELDGFGNPRQHNPIPHKNLMGIPRKNNTAIMKQSNVYRLPDGVMNFLFCRLWIGQSEDDAMYLIQTDLNSFKWVHSSEIIYNYKDDRYDSDVVRDMVYPMEVTEEVRDEQDGVIHITTRKVTRYFDVGFRLSAKVEEGDYLVGKSYSIRDTGTALAGVDKNGFAIPITSDDYVNGKLHLEFISPMDNYINTSHPFTRPWWSPVNSTNIAVPNTLSFTESICIKKLQAEVVVGDDVQYDNGETTNDIAYSSDMHTDFISEKEISFKLNSQLSVLEQREKKVVQNVNRGSVILNNLSALKKLKRADGEEAHPEELVVDDQYKTYATPKVIYTTQVRADKLTDSFSKITFNNGQFPTNKTFYTCSESENLHECVKNITLREI